MSPSVSSSRPWTLVSSSIPQTSSYEPTLRSPFDDLSRHRRSCASSTAHSSPPPRCMHAQSAAQSHSCDALEFPLDDARAEDTVPFFIRLALPVHAATSTPLTPIATAAADVTPPVAPAPRAIDKNDILHTLLSLSLSLRTPRSTTYSSLFNHAVDKSSIHTYTHTFFFVSYPSLSLSLSLCLSVCVHVLPATALALLKKKIAQWEFFVSSFCSCMPLRRASISPCLDIKKRERGRRKAKKK